MSALGRGLPDLGASRAVQVEQVTVIPLAAVEVFPGGIPTLGGLAVLRLLDVQHGIAYLVTYDAAGLAQLHAHIKAVLDQVADPTNNGGSSHE